MLSNSSVFSFCKTLDSSLFLFVLIWGFECCRSIYFHDSWRPIWNRCYNSSLWHQTVPGLRATNAPQCYWVFYFYVNPSNCLKLNIIDVLQVCYWSVCNMHICFIINLKDTTEMVLKTAVMAYSKRWYMYLDTRRMHLRWMKLHT